MKTLILLALLLPAYSFAFFENRDSAEYYYNRGIEEDLANRFSIAGKNYDKAIELNPAYTEAYLANAKVNMKMSRIYQAGQYLEKVYGLEPDNPEVIRELTFFYFNNRQYQKSIELAENCLKCDGMNRVLGMNYYHTEDYGKAMDYLKKAIGQNNKDAVAHYALGQTFLELEDLKGAIMNYMKAIELEPSRSAWAYELGLLYYNRSDYKNALAYFDKAATAGYRTTNDFYENYGFAQLYNGDSEKGLKTLETILLKKPNNRDLLNNIAFALYGTKKYELAIVYYEKLLTLKPDDAASLFMAGMTFQKMGQKQLGEKICDKAIEMDPSLAKNREKKEMPMGL